MEVNCQLQVPTVLFPEHKQPAYSREGPVGLRASLDK